jgi:methylmalonyl-CoA/ethylmalonyl-CoA epimerase
MKPTHIEHIGIAVKSLDESIPLFEKLLGTACYAVEEVKDQHVRTAFFLLGQTKIELLEATDPESTIATFVEKKGAGIHHIAFAVEKADQALMLAKENGFKLIDKVSRKGAEGMDIGFLHPRSTQGILVEFCSKKENI